MRQTQAKALQSAEVHREKNTKVKLQRGSPATQRAPAAVCSDTHVCLCVTECVPARRALINEGPFCGNMRETCSLG